MENPGEGSSISESVADPEAMIMESEVVGEPVPEDAETTVAGPESGPRVEPTAVEGEHTCSECGRSFPRRYSLIMHTLKHEKARGYKCHVSVHVSLSHV